MLLIIPAIVSAPAKISKIVFIPRGVEMRETGHGSALFFVEMSCKSYVNPELNSEIA
jgi:hypothetical protein